MKRKLIFFFCALLLSGLAAFWSACDDSCEGLGKAADAQGCTSPSQSAQCQKRFDQLVSHGCPAPTPTPTPCVPGVPCECGLPCV